METQNITISSDDWTQIATDTDEFVVTSIVISYEIVLTETNTKPPMSISGHVVDSDYSLSRGPSGSNQGDFGAGFVWARLRNYLSDPITADIAVSK